MKALWIALALAATPAAAQAPWFGVPTPGPVTPPDQATLRMGPNAYGPAPFAGRPKDDVRGALTGGKMMADVKTVVGFSLERKAAGDPLWGRISGLEGDKRAVDWAVARLKAVGLSDARAESYPSENPLWDRSLLVMPIFIKKARRKASPGLATGPPAGCCAPAASHRPRTGPGRPWRVGPGSRCLRSGFRRRPGTGGS